MPKKYCFLLLGWFVVFSGWAQDQKKNLAIGSAYAGLTYLEPLGHFRQTTPKLKAGGGLVGVLVNPAPGRSPLELGAEAGYTTYGIDKTQVKLPGDSYVLKTTHNIAPIHAVLRLKPHKQMLLTPYVDGLAGITVFNSRTKIKNVRENDEPVIMGKHNKTVFSYGLGGGVQIGLSPNILADLRLVYLQGPISRYVKKGQVSADSDGYPIYQFTHSETNMILVQLNVVGIIRHGY